MELQWSTDPIGPNGHTPTTFGPDGPWQALLVEMNNRTRSPLDFGFRPFTAPMWPSGIGVTTILTQQGGGRFALTGAEAYGSQLEDPWLTDMFADFSRWEPQSIRTMDDLISLPSLQQGASHSSVVINTPLVAISSWKVNLPGGRTYTPQVGELSLGPDGPYATLPTHSVMWVIEPIGVIDWSLGWLLDVTIGVEIGGEPFNESAISFYAKDPELMGGSLGANHSARIAVRLNPATPGIYLSLRVCETVASYLPVTWNRKLGYYLWDVLDPSYTRIVNSPACLPWLHIRQWNLGGSARTWITPSFKVHD
ncbi:hypothetical protein B0H63DRAFT_446261 [Podospora didyma]|uniref:Uncharacterized protein n=1 Tax=Podospora didyma TaxID=330526 RepID=A0AAE0U440_9PEZI|nr:hypothetical protein B0H63DRAFT_446261 [Podospora didyma]